LRSGCLRAWAGAVALVSAAVAVLKPYVPLLSLGVLYELAVLPVAVLWGLVRLATAVSVSSMLAFNRFFLPPTHTFQLSDGANWLALATYLVTGIVVGLLATRARRRAELIAEKTLEAEAVRRSDAMKTAVLHAVSHDLRSPLIRRETLSPRDHTDAVPLLSAAGTGGAMTAMTLSSRPRACVRRLFCPLARFLPPRCRLSAVNGSRFQSLQRSRNRIPKSCAIRSSSAGQTYWNRGRWRSR
jgi:hypothetical protein